MAKATIDDAATFINGQAQSKVRVIGHTDTAGSKAYNLALSRRRANTVAKALTSHGVSNPAVETEWKGETDLAVPTKDGVAKQANRRTEINVTY